ncbi:polyamine-transporting ATPase 13A3-like [Hylaeus volcanicus]|uniref:polyamine-transporting ATPase 13A3-like n=1 Tax=Hylaeus volcanicus TaxID=313075 RepID=UPI0023B7B3B2|nr:polyamine-transporting ATPase 13A3-like [Hylaeus volcanicus]
MSFSLSLPVYLDPLDERVSNFDRVVLVDLYAQSITRDILFFILSFLTLGIFSLVLSWFPVRYYRFRYIKTSDIALAKYCIVTCENQKQDIVFCQYVHVTGKEFSSCCLRTTSLLTLKKHTSKSLSFDENKKFVTIKFIYQQRPYLYNIWSHQFESIQFNRHMPSQTLYETYGDNLLTDALREERKQIYGLCSVEMEAKPLFTLFVSEVFHPFYIFQIAAIGAWIWDQYYQYAAAIICITVVSLCVEVYEINRTQKRFQKMAQGFTTVRVCSKENESCIKEMSSSNLVPGDLIILENNMILPCDILLLRGSVFVNEDVLTGETAPILKSSLASASQNSKTFLIHDDANHTLYGGTKILITRLSIEQTHCSIKPLQSYVYGMVIRTGFSTKQGHMLRCILYPSFHDSASFKEETYKFMGLLAILAFCGSILTAILSYRVNLALGPLIHRSVDSFSNALPPSLTASMTVGCTIAVERLRRVYKIFCLQPSRINIAGQVNTVVFDKTGTLTVLGLQLEGVSYSRLLDQQIFDTPCAPDKNKHFLFSSMIDDVYQIPDILLKAMGTCHTVVVVNDELLGDPMEVQMLQFSMFSIMSEKSTFSSQEENYSVNNESPKNESSVRKLDLPCLFKVGRILSPCETTQSMNFLYTKQNKNTNENKAQSLNDVLYVVKCFEFSSYLQRMSVIVYDRLKKELWVFMKGAPEQIEPRCLPFSVPVDFKETLRRHTEAGMRVLVVAGKRLNLPPESLQNYDFRQSKHSSLYNFVQSLSREEVEQGVYLLGMTIFNNQLKPETRRIIQELRQANCRSLMSTGDNPLTAVAVARSTGLIDFSKEIVLLGDVASTVASNSLSISSIVWSPILHSPTVDSSNARLDIFPKSDSSLLNSETALGFVDEESLYHETGTPKEFLQTRKTNSSFCETNEDVPCIVSLRNLTETSKSQILTSGTYTSAEIKKYLHGKDPRDIVIVLTGAAFRTLRSQHDRVVAVNPFKSKTNDNTRVNCLFTGETKNQKFNIHFFTNFFLKREAPLPTSNLSDLESLVAPSNQPNKRNIESSLLLRVLLPRDHHSGLHYKCSVLCQKNSNFDMNSKQATLQESCVGGSSESCKNFQLKETQKYSDRFTNNDNIEKMKDEVFVDITFFEYCLRYCRIYARMLPDDKATLITSLQDLSGDPAVGMCGDGANDCAALQVASFGISMSDKEASIAASFTSGAQSLTNVIDLLREARSALINSFQCFKYIAFYAFIQLFSSLVLYYYGTNLTDAQYLWIDLIVVLPLSMTMAWTHASDTLTSKFPDRRLIGLPVVLSLVGQIIIQIIFTILAIVLLETSNFYVRFIPDSTKTHFDSDDLQGYENTVVFIVSSFQYIVACLALSMGRPWRKPIYTNTIFTGIMVILSISSILFLLSPTTISKLSVWLAIVPLPSYFRISLSLLVICNSVTTLLFEKIVVRKLARDYQARKDFLAYFIDGGFPLNKKDQLCFFHI